MLGVWTLHCRIRRSDKYGYSEQTPTNILGTKMSEDTNEDDEDDQELYRVKKADDYVERFALDTSVAVDRKKESFFIDFQRAADDVLIDEDEETAGIDGGRESSVRIYLTPTGIQGLIDELRLFEGDIYEADKDSEPAEEEQ